MNTLLSRFLFYFFVEDTAIFDKERLFTNVIANNIAENGSDLEDLFAKLNSRKTDFPNYITDFPFVNGGLFKDEIISLSFQKKPQDKSYINHSYIRA
ncbi:type IIL restriction-modification enzyme MmeI [Kaistella sp.]|uniref:type IIL restriction-modification enzyme MmeI n=1 Tax=Kaistella sp. TaxID=2782235 RepID=UPI003C39F024